MHERHQLLKRVRCKKVTSSGKTMNNVSSEDLHNWLDSLPLSRPKKSIARDFADGVLVAEIIAHYFPKIVELHNYCPASSWVQKKVNWQTLNRRVFGKMGMRIPDDVIVQVTHSKPGVAEKILWDIRGKIESLRALPEGKTHIILNSKSRKPSQQPYTSISSTTLPVQAQELHNRPHTAEGQSPQLTYRVFDPSSSVLPNAEPYEEYGKHPKIDPGCYDGDDNLSDCSLEKEVTHSVVNNYAGQSRSRRSPAFNLPAIDTNKNGLNTFFPNSYELGVNPVTSKNQSPNLASPMTNPKVETPNLGGAPAQIIYRGHKMIPLQFLEEKDKEIKALESCNRSLTYKIYRLETVVTVKDQRIEDLTHQLQNLRSMYERITERVFQG